MHPLELRLRHLCLSVPLPVRDSRILVAVSGGIDSMALVHLLAALRYEFSLTLVAAYVDHGLRPEETPGEWDCVQAAASRLGINSVSRKVHVRALAEGEKISLEHAARQLRYCALAELGREQGAGLLAVGHTADDQAEELLLRLLRGGSRRSLSGMRPCSGTLLRPLLSLRKAELAGYLSDKGITHCHDSSNDDLRHLRNRIRHDLLPLLESRYDPGVRQALLKTGAILAEEEDLLEHLAAQSWQETVEIRSAADGAMTCILARHPFQQLHPALQRRLVEKLLFSVGDSAGYEQIMAVLAAARSGRNGSELHLSRGLRVRVGRDQLEFSYPWGKGPWRGRLWPR